MRPVTLTIKKFQEYYERLYGFDVLFNDFIGNDFESFVSCFVIQDMDGNIHPTGLLWEVDDVGILYLTDIAPRMEGKAHFTFWDQRLRGREQLVREMCEYVIRKFKLHRLNVEVPLYSRPTLKFVERVGFTKEGRKREAVLYHDEWWDLNIYSMLEQEISNGKPTD